MGSRERQERVIASCSFCLKDNTQAARLIAGPGVYICDACVEACAEILKTKPAQVERVAPWERELSDQALLDILPRVAGTGALADRALTEWVRKARAQGISWARIGAALGMTRQSAWERFSGAS